MSFLWPSQQCQSFKRNKLLILSEMNIACINVVIYHCGILPSVLWHCWLGGRKGIEPVKTEWWGTGMVICMEQGANDCIWSSSCHCHPIVSCSGKIQNGLPFWCRLTQVVLEKRPLNGCSSSSSSLSLLFFCREWRWRASLQGAVHLLSGVWWYMKKEWGQVTCWSLGITHTTVLWPFSGTAWVNWCKKKSSGLLWCKGR